MKPGGQPSSGDQSKSQQQQETGKQKDQTASKPEEGEGQEQQEQQKNGEKPQGNQQSKNDPQDNQQGQMPEQEVANPLAVDPRFEVWGELPIHLRDIFRAEGGVDVPAQYRDWIDSYYRRLNRRGE